MKSPLIYFISDPLEWGINTEARKTVGKHHGKLNHKRRLILWPDRLNNVAVSPEEFKSLKEETGNDEWLIVDSLTPAAEIYWIRNHINRSGSNFLRGKTPFEDRVMFPDVSNIYKPIDRLPGVTVSTLGQGRFGREPTEEKAVWSLGIGLVAPVAHYMGIDLSAVGTEPGADKADRILSLQGV